MDELLNTIIITGLILDDDELAEKVDDLIPIHGNDETDEFEFVDMVEDEDELLEKRIDADATDEEMLDDYLIQLEIVDDEVEVQTISVITDEMDEID